RARADHVPRPLRHRRAAGRGAFAREPRRRLSPLPARDERLRALDSEERRVIELVPERVLRSAIRVNCARRLRTERRGGEGRQPAFVEELRRSPIADRVEKPNEQHYELPAEFFQLVLGPRLKYSSCYWPAGVDTLAAAEEAMLRLSCRRAGVEDGMELLD